MSDDIAREILRIAREIQRIDARIQRLRSLRAVLLKMRQRSGAAPGPQRAGRGLNGGVLGVVLGCVKDAHPNSLTTGQVVDGVVAERAETTPQSVRAQLYQLRNRGLIKGNAEGWAAVLRKRA